MTTMSDTQAAEAVRAHHRQMVEHLTGLVADVVRAGDVEGHGERGVPDGPGEAGMPYPEARKALVAWAREELVPHALGEERTFYSAAATLEQGRLLVESLVSDHRVILGLVDAVEESTAQAATVAWASALLRVFTAHAAKENDLVLPLLVAAEEASVVEELRAMHRRA